MTIRVLQKNQHPFDGFDVITAAAEKYGEMRNSLCRRSQTATRLFQQLDGASAVVGIILLNSLGEEAQDNTMVPPSDALLELDPTLTGGVAIVNIANPITFNVPGRKVTLPPEISLAHELGHAMQFIDNPTAYLDTFSHITEQNEQVMVQAGSVALHGLARSVNLKNVAMLQIENRNVAQWEAPICQEFGLTTYRRNYEGGAYVEGQVYNPPSAFG